jgi:hypothetical protein
MRVHSAATFVAVGFSGILSGVPAALAAPASPFEILNAVPAPPANVAAAGAATQVATGSDVTLAAPAYDASQARIKAAATPTGSVGGFDMARATSDPAYAQQMQARMQTMSMAEKMAMANQVMASQQASAASNGPVVAFVGGQRGADMAAQQRMRALLDGALASTGGKHRAIDTAIDAAAKACPQDKTGWPLQSCTGPLGTKSIAQHRALEDASLASEIQALAQARQIALVELNKGKDLLAHASGPSAASLNAWAMTYVLTLNDYAKAITLRAGFWAHADASKYTGSVTPYVRAPGDGEIFWPLKNSAETAVGL